MSYSLIGRIESRLASSLVAFLVALVLARYLDMVWPLQVAGLMLAVGLVLDCVVYHRVFRYQPAWTTLPLGLAEFGIVYAIAYAFSLRARPIQAIGLFAVAWVLTQILTHAVFPRLALSWPEDGGQFGLLGRGVFVVGVAIVAAGALPWPGTENSGAHACVRPAGPERTPLGHEPPYDCANVAERVGLSFTGSYGKTSDIGVDAREGMSRAMQANMGNGAAVGDYDNDGDLDVYLLGQRGEGSRLFRNQLVESGRARFVDVTQLAGVGDRGMGRVALFGDLDGDGLLDLVLVNDYVPEDGDMLPSRIFRNTGHGRFQDVTRRSGFDPLGLIVGGAALTDYDGDGRLDIFVTYWTMTVPVPAFGFTSPEILPGKNTMFRNLGGFRFADATDATALGERSNSFTPVFADFDRDDDLDLFVAHDTGGPDRYFDNRDGAFKDVSHDVGASHRGADMGVATGDLDGNGGLDLYVTNISDPEGDFGFSSGNSLLLARAGAIGPVSFAERAHALGVHDTGWGWGTAFVDVDLDGDLDIYAVQGMDAVVTGASRRLRTARARLFVNDGRGRFAPASSRGFDVEGDQRALVVFDYDRDGDPDFLVTQVDRHVQLLENRSQVGNWLTVAPESGPSQTVPGAEVSVTVGGRTTTQVILAGGSYLAGPPAEAYFGLGAAKRADEVRVRWPGGRVTVLRNVRGGQVLHLSPSG